MPPTDLDRMLHPDEARRIVLEHVRPLEPLRVPLTEAGDRVLAEPLIADVDLPPFRASTMDGYAVIHDDPQTAREVIGQQLAGGEASGKLRSGTAIKIMTGAPVPDGADAVVPVENTSANGNQVEILQPLVRSGDNIRPIGSDMQRGDLLVDEGVRLGPAEIGLLASLGRTSVVVGRRPRVAIMSTGDELVEPGEQPGPGQIRDSNRFSLAVAAGRAGAEVVINRHVPDDEGAIRAAFGQAVAAADVVVTSGGVSMGDRDLVKALLGELAEVHFRRVFMKPGKPLNFATAGDKLLFGLPGNPVSCLVSFHLFARPALLIMQGSDGSEDPSIPVRVLHDIQPSDRIEYQRAVISAGLDGAFTASTTGSQQSARLMSFIGANGFLVVPPGEDLIPAGSTLPALLLETPRASDGRE